MLITLIATIAGLGIGLWRGEPLVFALLGLLAGRVIALDIQLRRLQRRSAPEVHPPDTEPEGASPLTLDVDWLGKPPSEAPARVASEGAHHLTVDGAAAKDLRTSPAWVDSLRTWLTTGNLFVRIGVLLVLLGVGFLIKYAVDQHWLELTLGLRLAAVAAAGLGLLALGWILRRRQRDYGQLLQGAAIGILYLDVYGAYQLAQLLPATPTFALLALLGLSAAALAVVQNAPSLAWLGLTGGFLAPIVASSGSDDQIALFSYYAVLNAVILGVAWLRSWRALNLLGFAFTFGIGVAWGVLRYAPERFASTEPFLALFFLFYVAIAVLYAFRQPPRLRGYVDATLIFGTPIIAFACQVALVRPMEHGIAWSAALVGTFYPALSWWLSRRSEEGLELLSQAFLALGVIFLSVAVPFAVAADTTAGVWALEGAGIVWIGSRQGQWLKRVFGLLLQAGAAVALIVGGPYDVAQPFINAAYLGAALIAAAGAVSAYWLDRADARSRGAPWLLAWSLAWWLGGGLVELLRLDAGAALGANGLWYASLTLVITEAAASLVRWPRLQRVQAGLPLLGLGALALSLDRVTHPGLSGGLAAWPLYLALGYLVLFRVEQRETRRYLGWSHTALTLLMLGVLEWEIVWRVRAQLAPAEGWRLAADTLVPLIGLLALTRLKVWPLTAWRYAYGIWVGGILALTLVLWTLWSAHSPGGAAPLPWVPVLNPLDGTSALILAALWHWWRTLERERLRAPSAQATGVAQAIFGTLGFLWVNVALLRALHHAWAIPYAWDPLFHSDQVQTALAVLWGLVGVGLLLLARRLQSRPFWIAGAIVLAAVVVKLLTVDLGASGTLERILSFLAVGGLLVSIGWWSPLPPRTGSSLKGAPAEGAQDRAERRMPEAPK